MRWPVAKTSPFAGYERPAHIAAWNRHRIVEKRQSIHTYQGNKLEDEHVSFMRRLRNEEGLMHKEIASRLLDKYGIDVHVTTVSKVVNGTRHSND